MSSVQKCSYIGVALALKKYSPHVFMCERQVLKDIHRTCTAGGCPWRAWPDGGVSRPRPAAVTCLYNLVCQHHHHINKYIEEQRVELRNISPSEGFLNGRYSGSTCIADSILTYIIRQGRGPLKAYFSGAYFMSHYSRSRPRRYGNTIYFPR